MRIVDRTAYNVTGGKDNNDVAFEQFIAGNIGCDGPVGRWKVPRLMNDVKFHWDCVPVPYKEKEIPGVADLPHRLDDGGAHAVSRSSASTSSNSSAAPRARACRRGPGLAIPPLISVANSPDFLDPPGMRSTMRRSFSTRSGYARIQQLPRQQEWWNDIITNALNPAIQQGTQTSMESGERSRAAVDQRDRFPAQPPHRFPADALEQRRRDRPWRDW
jgi:hypothetical protein